MCLLAQELSLKERTDVLIIKAVEYVLNIKRKYVQRFGRESFDLKEMISALDIVEYNNFAKCVNIVQRDEFCLLSYSLIKGGDIDIFDNPDSIYRDLRGTVVDLKREKLVLLPFHKFFNIGEIQESSIETVIEKIKNADTVEITDKMDGSMISISCYEGDIFVAGSGSLSEEKNPRILEAKAYLTKDHIAMIKQYDNFTFMFELIGKEPQIVQYPRDRWGLYLTGARGKVTGNLMTYFELSQLAGSYGIPMVRIEKITFDEMISLRNKYNCLEKEGWVLRVDDTLYKVKCEDFINMHRLASTNPNGILNLWREGKLDDIKSRMSDSMREYVERYTDRFHIYARRRTEEINHLYSEYSDIEDMKSFAMAVRNLDKRTQGYLFCLKRGKPLDIFKGVEYSDIEKYLTK